MESLCQAAHRNPVLCLIRDQYAAILPEMCLDMFPEFEQLMCVGCHFMQPTVMTTTDEVKEISKEAMSVHNYDFHILMLYIHACPNPTLQ